MAITAWPALGRRPAGPRHPAPAPDAAALGGFSRAELAQLTLGYARDFDPAKLPVGVAMLGEVFHADCAFSAAVVVRERAGRISDAVLVHHFTDPLELRTLLGNGDVATANLYREGSTAIAQSDAALAFWRSRAPALRERGVALGIAGYSLGGTQAIDLVGRLLLEGLPDPALPRAWTIAAIDPGPTLRARGVDLARLEPLVTNEVIENDSICGTRGCYGLSRAGRVVLLPRVRAGAGWRARLGRLLGDDVDGLIGALASHIPTVYAPLYGLGPDEVA